MLADPLSSHVTHLLGACARPFSADREYLHATHQSFTRPPMAIIAQCVVVLFACTWGIVIATPGLKPIRVISGQGDIRCALSQQQALMLVYGSFRARRAK